MKITSLIVMSLALILTSINCSKTDNSQSKKKVIIIGIDGANWNTMDPLIKKGKLPYFEKLKQNSAWGDCKTFKPTKSSIIWTSIATGKTMEKHGIMDFAYMKKNNIQIPFSNIEKREPSIWQILSDYNKTSIVLNWWITYPPDEIKGIMVSSAFRKSILRQQRYLNNYKDTVYPLHYFDKIKGIRELSLPKIFEKTGLVDYPKMYENRYPGKSFNDVKVLKAFRIIAKQDYLINMVADELYNKEKFDLFAVYYRMPDVVQHFIVRLLEEKDFEKYKKYIYSKDIPDKIRNQIIRKLANLLYPAYRYMEKMVKSMITNPKYKDCYFIILSDHGFNLGPGYNHYGVPQDIKAPDGIFILHGPDVKAGKLKDVSVFDVAPTALYLFGLPIGKNMDGRVVFEAFNKKRPVKYKAYKLKKKKLKRDSKKDEQEIKELKSLGYIDG